MISLDDRARNRIRHQPTNGGATEQEAGPVSKLCGRGDFCDECGSEGDVGPGEEAEEAGEAEESGDAGGGDPECKDEDRGGAADETEDIKTTEFIGNDSSRTTTKEAILIVSHCMLSKKGSAKRTSQR